MQTLIDSGVKTIFYPCMTYNLNENLGDNHYNCPVVAYYPEIIAGNLPAPKDVTLITDYVGLHRKKDFPQKMQQILAKYFTGITVQQVRQAMEAGSQAYHHYFDQVRQKGQQIIDEARTQGKPIIVLAGRPYHVDPEVNHGIDKLICALWRRCRVGRLRQPARREIPHRSAQPMDVSRPPLCGSPLHCRPTRYGSSAAGLFRLWVWMR